MLLRNVEALRDIVDRYQRSVRDRDPNQGAQSVVGMKRQPHFLHREARSGTIKVRVGENAVRIYVSS
jgi:hypothetical protein